MDRDKKNGPIEIAQQELFLGKSFTKSWWSLFLIPSFIAVIAFNEYFKFVKPYIESIKDEATQGNMAVLAILIYFIITIAVPFFTIYGITKFIKKRRVSSHN